MRTNRTRVIILLMASLMAMCVLFGCGGKTEVPNVKTAKMEDMVSYFQEKGYIKEEAQSVNINETSGYLTDNTGGEFTDTTVADEAYDYDGLYIFWWDLENPTENYENYESMGMNSGVIVIQGGAAIMETSAQNGAFAIAFSEDYADKDKVIEDFSSLSAE